MHDVLADFHTHAARIVWCNVASVGPDGRPRSRLLHPVWERVDDRLVGWVLTNPTPIKHARTSRRIRTCPAATGIPSTTRPWPSAAPRGTTTSPPSGPPSSPPTPPMGYDPAVLGIWDGPDDPSCAAIRLDPWQVVVRTLPEMTEGKRPRVWRA